MRVILTVIIWALAFARAGSQDTKTIDAPLKYVTVFSDRAQLTHEGTTDLAAGKTEMKLSGLSPYIDPQSIKVAGTGGYTILSVVHSNNYIDNLDEIPEVKNLKAQIESLELKVEDEKAAISVLKEKEAFLTANRTVPGKEANITIDYLKAVMDLYTSNMEQVTQGVLKRTRLIRDYETRLAALRKQLSELTGRNRLPSGEITVTVSSGKPVRAQVTVSYVTSGAGWYPSYDIRSDNVSKPVNIIYKANLQQNTGVSWKNVRLSFSNASPNAGGTLPALYPWFVDFNYPSPPVMIRGFSAVAKSEAPAALEIADEKSLAPEPEAMAVNTLKQTGQTTVTFEVAEPYSVEPDGKILTIEIQKTISQAEYKYVLIPKLSPHAYLTANITGWAKESFQSGEATLYFENSFIGKSYLNAGQLSDTLPVSLGTDNSIIVRREKRKDFTGTRTIGANKTVTLSFLITIRNNKSQAVNMTLEDQIPLSSNSGITIELLDSSGGRLNKETGVIKWDFLLNPGESRELILTYSVKYPKDRTIILE